jgi:poly-gamma-glutamate capsule biosynthesis protein CapA/YwtB (metallophosphatase superfamily)
MDAMTQLHNSSPNKETVTLLAVGDIMLGGGVGVKIDEKGPDWPYLKIKDVFKDADIVFGGLEAPVSTEGIPNPEKPKDFPLLKCTPEAIRGLKNLCLTIAHIGTNHILDFGSKGLEDTIEVLNKLGIKHLGAGKNLGSARQPVIIEKKGIKFAFLGYCMSYPADEQNPGCAPLKREYMVSDINKIRDHVDFVIVSLHHGIEYSFYPYPEHIQLVRSLIDNGANIVLGHHPHVLQGYEEYYGGVIFYSLGNFIFDDDKKVVDLKSVSRIRVMLEEKGIVSKPGGPKFYESMVVTINFDKNDIKRIDFLPIIINSDCQPTLAEGKKRYEIRHFFENISSALHDGGAWYFSQLARLYLAEDMALLLRRDIRQLLPLLGRVRCRHVRKLFTYAYSLVFQRMGG